MRYGPNDPFWIVTNPSLRSELADICFETSLERLALQFKGGLSMDAEPTLFTDRREAEAEARGRLLARDTARAIAARAAEGIAFDGARRLQVLGKGGDVLFEADIE